MRINGKNRRVALWHEQMTTFDLDGVRYQLFCHTYNCGWPPTRMTERSVELALAGEWLNSHPNACEIGAVTPYYWPRRVMDIYDPADEHSLVTHKQSVLDADLKSRDVLSISTVEHIGLGEYGLQEKPGLAIAAFEKIVVESASCLVTFPCGYNLDLEEHVRYRSAEGLSISYLKRSKEKDNLWLQVESEEARVGYGPLWANGIIVVRK